MAIIASERSDPIRIVRRATAGGRIRTFTILSRAESSAWDDLAGRIAVPLERRLADGVVANRARFSSGWSLEPLTRAHARASAQARGWPGRSLVTDVVDFYGSIAADVAETACLEAGAQPRDARRVRELLERWAAQGARGLPVGPRGSAVIANAVLLPVDRELGGRPFLRWVDDYRIAVGSDGDVAGMLARLDGALAARGLRRSAAKTRLVRRDDPWPGSLSLAGSSDPGSAPGGTIPRLVRSPGSRPGGARAHPLSSDPRPQPIVRG